MSSTPGAAPPRPAVEAIKCLLNKTMRISTSDDRIFIGSFVCVDKLNNIILTNAEEYRVSAGATSQGRYVTMIMVPQRMTTKVEVRSLSMGLDWPAASAPPPESEDEEDVYT